MKFLRNILDKAETYFAKGSRYEKFWPLYDAPDTFLFSTNKITKNAPFLRDQIDLKRSMFFVVLALIPCLSFGVYNVGLQSKISSGIPFSEAINLPLYDLLMIGLLSVVPLYIVTFTVGGICEAIFSVVRGHEINEGFLVTGMLIPLVMPASLPLWMVAASTVFGVVIGKEIFGGTGYNIFNPALLARSFVFFAYPGQISGDRVWTFDAVSGATPLLAVSSNNSADSYSDALINSATGHIYTWSDMFIGFIPGSIGETSTLMVLIGASFLLLTGLINFRTISGVMIGMILTSYLMNLLGTSTNSSNLMLFIPWYYHLVMGGFAFGMIFMATEPVTSAHTNTGRWIYGILIGIMCILIRCINPAYPEGMMLGILFANALAPLIDYYVVKSHKKKRIKRFA